MTKLLIAGAFAVLVSIGYSQQLQVTFRVADDLDKPVAGASVNLFTYQTTKAGEGFGEDVYQKATGVTDTNGMVTLAGSSPHADIKYGVAPKEGYYYTEPGHIRIRSNYSGSRAVVSKRARAVEVNHIGNNLTVQVERVRAKSHAAAAQGVARAELQRAARWP